MYRSNDFADATQRFFQSTVNKESLKSKGKYGDKVKRTRKRNRICRVSIHSTRVS